MVGNYECVDLATARSLIMSVGLVVGTVFPGDGEEFNTWNVASQNPQPGEEAQPGSDVDLVVIDPAGPCPPA